MKLSLKLQIADTILADSMCLVGATADFINHSKFRYCFMVTLYIVICIRNSSQV